MSTTILTDEQIIHLWDTRVGDPTECMPLVDSDKEAFAHAIEQAVLQSPEVQALRKDAERYQWATALDDNAETLYSIVLSYGGDQAKINERVDAYRPDAATKEQP